MKKLFIALMILTVCLLQLSLAAIKGGGSTWVYDGIQLIPGGEIVGQNMNDDGEAPNPPLLLDDGEGGYLLFYDVYMSGVGTLEGKCNVRIKRINDQGQLLWQQTIDGGFNRFDASRPTEFWLSNREQSKPAVLTADGKIVMAFMTANSTWEQDWANIDFAKLNLSDGNIITVEAARGPFTGGGLVTIPPYPINYKADPIVETDGDKGAFIIYTQSSYRWWAHSTYEVVYCQYLDPDANITMDWDGVEITREVDQPIRGKVTVSAGPNKAFLVWQQNDDILGAKLEYNPSGPTVEVSHFSICAAAGSQKNFQRSHAWTAICSDGSNGFVYAWLDRRDGNYNIYAQRVSSTGTAVWTANGIAICNTGAGQRDYPTVKLLDDEHVLISWVDQRDPSKLYQIYGMKVKLSDGSPVWSEGLSGRVLTDGGKEIYPLYAADGSGGLYLFYTSTAASASELETWLQNYNLGAYDFTFDMNVYAMHFDGEGESLWPQGAIPLTSQGDAQWTFYGGLANSAPLIVWQDFRNSASEIYGASLIDISTFDLNNVKIEGKDMAGSASPISVSDEPLITGSLVVDSDFAHILSTDSLSFGLALNGTFYDVTPKTFSKSGTEASFSLEQKFVLGQNTLTFSVFDLYGNSASVWSYIDAYENIMGLNITSVKVDDFTVGTGPVVSSLQPEIKVFFNVDPDFTGELTSDAFAINLSIDGEEETITDYLFIADGTEGRIRFEKPSAFAGAGLKNGALLLSHGLGYSDSKSIVFDVKGPSFTPLTTSNYVKMEKKVIVKVFLPQPGVVLIEVYDSMGNMITFKQFDSAPPVGFGASQVESGQYEFELEAPRDLAKGIYPYLVHLDGQPAAKGYLVVK